MKVTFVSAPAVLKLQLFSFADLFSYFCEQHQKIFRENKFCKMSYFDIALLHIVSGIKILSENKQPISDLSVYLQSHVMDHLL